MITNKMFRWFVVKDNFLDNQTCEELVKYCNERENKSTELSKKYLGGKQTQDDMDNTKQELFEVEDKVLINNVWSLFKTTNDIYYKFKIDQLWENTLLIRKYNQNSNSFLHTDFGSEEFI